MPGEGRLAPGRAQILVTGAGVVTFLALALALYGCTLDDAFISFRYAENLAHGLGPVFNPGERVEGFSNPAWVLILALGALLRVDVPTLAKLLGLASGALALLLADRIADRLLGLSRWARAATVLYLSTNIGFVYYAISGMETALYGLGILLVIALVADGRHGMAAAACGVVALTRPEGILMAVPLGIGVLAATRSPARALVRCAVPAAAAAAYEVFRLAYYGALLPNSHAAKTVDAAALSLTWPVEALRALFRYTLFEPAMSPGMILLAVAGACVVAGRRTAALLAALGSSALFVAYARVDWMHFWRFYVPVLPLLAGLSFGALDRLAGAASRPYQRGLLAGVAATLVVAGAWTCVADIRLLNEGELFNPAMHSRPHVALGKYLGEHAGRDEVIVVNEIGAIAYYSGLRTVDMLGLTDRGIPPLLREVRLDAYADYILAQRPTYIMLNDRQRPADREMHPYHAAIQARMQASGLYRPGPVVPLNRFKNLLIFVRRDAGTP